MTHERKGIYQIRALREKFDSALGHIRGIRRKISLHIDASTSSELSHDIQTTEVLLDPDAVNAKLDVAIWSQPGVRHQKLNDDDFAEIAKFGYQVISQDDSIRVKGKDAYFIFSKKGFLIKYKNKESVGAISYDLFGRVTFAQELHHDILATKYFTYSSDENDVFVEKSFSVNQNSGERLFIQLGGFGP